MRVSKKLITRNLPPLGIFLLITSQFRAILRCDLKAHLKTQAKKSSSRTEGQRLKKSEKELYATARTNEQ